MKRIASSLALATAALASVATSMVLPWLLEDSAEIPTVEVPTGTQGLAITGEARGTDHAGGRFDIHLELSGSPLNLVDPIVTVTVISEADPTVRETRLLSVSASTRQTVDLQVPAWETCDGSPCFEDYRIEIENQTEGTTVTALQGTVTARLDGLDDHPEPEDEVIVSVLPLGVIE